MSARLLFLVAALGAAGLAARAQGTVDSVFFSVVADRTWAATPPEAQFTTGVSDRASLARISGRIALDAPTAGESRAQLTLILDNPNVGLPIGYLEGFSLKLPPRITLSPGGFTQSASAGDWINFQPLASDPSQPLTLAAGGLTFPGETQPNQTSPTLAAGSVARFTLWLEGASPEWTLEHLFPASEDGRSFDLTFRFGQLYGSANSAIFDRVGLELTPFLAIPEPLTCAAWLASAAFGAAAWRRRRGAP